MRPAKLVRINGVEVWSFKDTDSHVNGYPLAPLHHCDSDGNLHIDAIFEGSYAHVFPNKEIRRYGKVIGHERDLMDVVIDAKGST